jgi:predicted DNA-binding protein (MmcQ/YjbR family)
MTVRTKTLSRKDLARQEYLLRHLRRLCLALPETAETVKWGNPTFVAGKKMFAVLDRYDNQWCIVFRKTLDEDAQLVQRSDIVPAPYSAKHGWVCLDAGGKMGWKEIEPWIRGSYRLAALKRMLAALGGSVGTARRTGR